MAFIKCSGGGSGLKYKTGSSNITSSAQSVSIDCRFKPTFIFVHHNGSDSTLSTSVPNGTIEYLYNSYLTTSLSFQFDRNTGSNYYLRRFSIPHTTSSQGSINNVSSTGFSYYAATSSQSQYRGTYSYWAFGE